MDTRKTRGAELIRRGVQFGRRGELEHGVLCLLEGLSLIDERQSPRLVLSAYHNLALFLAHLRLTVLARAVIVRARRLYRQVGDPVMDARLIWLQGTLARLTGNYQLAGRRLREAGALFESLGRDPQVSLVREELRETELRLRAEAQQARASG